MVGSRVPPVLEDEGQIKDLHDGLLEEGDLPVQQAALVDLPHVGVVGRDDLVQIARSAHLLVKLQPRRVQNLPKNTSL